jgi:ABC-type branched-subunit amino acid transport system ATPase component
VLRVDGLVKSFGGLRALDGCGLEAAADGITGLIGPNGSGKSTLFNCVTGFYRPDAGQVSFAGAPLTGLPPWEIARRGVVRTFQQARVFPRLTCLENLLFAPGGQPGEALIRALVRPAAVREREAALRARAEALLARVELADHADTLAGSLSYGQQKLLELARALMTEPRLLLLDEPAAGINPALLARLVELIRALHAEGKGFLIVEHDMPLVMTLCQRVVVLDYGQTIAAGTPDAIARDSRVLDAYLGTPAGGSVPQPLPPLGGEGGAGGVEGGLD